MRVVSVLKPWVKNLLCGSACIAGGALLSLVLSEKKHATECIGDVHIMPNGEVYVSIHEGEEQKLLTLKHVTFEVKRTKGDEKDGTKES